MKREDAIRRIRACLRLQSSSNPNEAAAALRQAQKLMAQYSIEQDEVAGVGHATARTRSRGGDLPAPIVELVALISRVFGVHPIERTVPGETSVVFVGIEPTPEVAAYVFAVLRRQLEAALAGFSRRKRVNLASRRAEFALGWVIAVRAKVEAVRPTVEQSAQIQTYIERTFRNLVTVPDRDAGAKKFDTGKISRDLLAGFVAGDKAQLHVGVGKNPTTPPSPAAQLALL